MSVLRMHVLWPKWPKRKLSSRLLPIKSGLFDGWITNFLFDTGCGGRMCQPLDFLMSFNANVLWYLV